MTQYSAHLPHRGLCTLGGSSVPCWLPAVVPQRLWLSFGLFACLPCCCDPYAPVRLHGCLSWPASNLLRTAAATSIAPPACCPACSPVRSGLSATKVPSHSYCTNTPVANGSSGDQWWAFSRKRVSTSPAAVTAAAMAAVTAAMRRRQAAVWMTRCHRCRH